MRIFLLFVHLAAAIVWMGGMAFALMILRTPVQEHLPPPLRLTLMRDVLERFFAGVALSIALLLATGGGLLMQAPPGGAPPGWRAMAGIGLLMMLIFGHLWFVPFRRLKTAVSAQDWPAGARHMLQITRLAQLNFVLGWAAIAAVLLWQ